MKKIIFDKYLKEVASLYRFSSTEEVFQKPHSRDHTNARYLLYFLSWRRGMSRREIIRYCTEYGFTPHRSNVINGTHKFNRLIEEDIDYSSVVRRIEQSVII
jgi:hypothetical protein